MKKTKVLQKKLVKAGFGVHYLEGHFKIPDKSIVMIEGVPVEIDNNQPGNDNARAVFLYNNDDLANAAGAIPNENGIEEEHILYYGLEEALEALKKQIEAIGGSIDFALGFSQGAGEYIPILLYIHIYCTIVPNDSRLTTHERVYICIHLGIPL